MKKMLLLSMFSLLVLYSCKTEQINNIPDEEVEPVSYANQIQPIFNNSCGGGPCHIGGRANRVDLTNYGATIASIGLSYGVEIVDAGNADNSPLVDKLFDNPDFGARMPLGRGSLSGDDIGLIIAWINQGAENN